MGPPPRGGGGSDGSARGGDTSGCPSQLLCAEGGSCTVQRSTEPEVRQSKWEAPWRPAGARGAGRAVTVGYVAARRRRSSLLRCWRTLRREAVDARTVKYLLEGRSEEEVGGGGGGGGGGGERGRSWRWSWREETSCSGVSQRLLRRRALLWSRVVAARGRGRRGGSVALPRSSVPRGGRPHRRQRQWYVLAGFPGYVTLRAVFPSIFDVRGDSTGAVLGLGDMPVVVPSGAFGQTVQKTADSPQLQSIAGRQHPLRAANAVPHGPGYSPDHRVSTVQVLLWRSPWRSHSCSSSRNLWLSTSPLYLAVILVCLVLPLEKRTTDFLGDDSGMVSVLGTPRFDSGHVGVSLRGFLEEFHTPLYLAVTCMVFGVRLWSTRVWIFWEMTPGIISVLNTPQFDSGYLFGVSLRSLLEVFSSFFNAMLGSTVDTSLRQTTEAGFTGYVAPRAVFLRCSQAPDACHHGRYGPEGMLCVAVQKTADPQLLFRAGRCHLFWYAEAVPHGPGYCRPQRFPSRSYLVVDVPVCAVVQVLGCCLFYDSRDPTVQLVLITVVVQRLIPWSRLFV